MAQDASTREAPTTTAGLAGARGAAGAAGVGAAKTGNAAAGLVGIDSGAVIAGRAD